MKTISLSLGVLAVVGLAAAGPGAGAAPTREPAVTLTQDPLVIRLGDDEFRIAFGIQGDRRVANGCTGSIRYAVDWKTADGIVRSDVKRVSYSISPLASRTIAVDRQYLDTAEGAHTTDVVKVRVEKITCL